MPATIRKLIVKPFGVIVNSDRCQRSWNRSTNPGNCPIYETARHHDERSDARMPTVFIRLSSISTATPKTGHNLLLGLRSKCSTVQYTFPGNLRPVCPFESESEKS